MGSCEKIRPLLPHYAEGELSPDEAMRLARHLADCTACKIILARERRLAEMLERDMEDLPVGDEFLDAVMATLPKDPPPGGRRPRRRGLKLAAIGGFFGSGAMLAAKGLSFQADWSSPVVVPVVEPETLPAAVDGLAGLVRVAGIAAEALTRAPLASPQLSGALIAAAAALALAAVSVGACSTALAMAARVMVRKVR
jgi:hypothetical protein